MTKIVPYIVPIKQWSFKIELHVHYLIFWTQIYNFLAVQVIYTNYASNVMVLFFILCLSSIFIFIFFPIAALWNSWKCNVIQQIKKLWPNAINKMLRLIVHLNLCFCFEPWTLNIRKHNGKNINKQNAVLNTSDTIIIYHKQKRRSLQRQILWPILNVLEWNDTSFQEIWGKWQLLVSVEHLCNLPAGFAVRDNLVTLFYVMKKYVTEKTS